MNLRHYHTLITFGSRGRGHNSALNQRKTEGENRRSPKVKQNPFWSRSGPVLSHWPRPCGPNELRVQQRRRFIAIIMPMNRTHFGDTQGQSGTAGTVGGQSGTVGDS